MNSAIANDIAGLLNNAAELYRQAATEACKQKQPFEVYMLIKESIALESKARRLVQRYGQVPM